MTAIAPVWFEIYGAFLIALMFAVFVSAVVGEVRDRRDERRVVEAPDDVERAA